MSWTCMQSFSFISLMVSEEKTFEYFFENLPFMLSWQPIKFSDLDKIHMNHRGLLKKYFCKKKKNLNIYRETAKIASFHFSHYKSMETISCHRTRVLIRLGQKTILFIPHRCYVWNMVKISFMTSEETSFENVDDGRRQMPAYTISSPMSLRLRWAKNRKTHQTPQNLEIDSSNW